jgi:hypothetical protein
MGVGQAVSHDLALLDMLSGTLTGQNGDAIDSAPPLQQLYESGQIDAPTVGFYLNRDSQSAECGSGQQQSSTLLIISERDHFRRCDQVVSMPINEARTSDQQISG